VQVLPADVDEQTALNNIMTVGPVARSRPTFLGRVAERIQFDVEESPSDRFTHTYVAIRVGDKGLLFSLSYSASDERKAQGQWKFVRDEFSPAPLGRLSLPMKRELIELNEDTFRETIRELLA